jgi:thiazole synthase
LSLAETARLNIWRFRFISGKGVNNVSDDLVIAGKHFKSRLIVGTGRYRTMEDMVQALDASGTEMVTVAIRRLDLDNPNEKTILDYIDWNRYNILPNTAGCQTVEEALFVARLGREVTKTDFVKLEVIPDPKYLFPDPAATLEAARRLVSEGFIVLPYIHADPVLARRLEEAGCATVMPLGSAIGSGQGIHTVEEIRIIIEQANVPVVVDAGLAVPSDASKALEMGADAVLVNTAIAQATNPALMAEAFKQGVEAGRKAHLAGRIPLRAYAAASSPTTDVPQPASARS